MSTTTLTVRLPAEVKDRLDRLAERTRRTKSFLAGEAIAGYVTHELAIIEGIHQGLDDMRAGRVIPHDQVMKEVRAIIEDAERGER
ncbi:MAG: type II toxin-antitoxin system RelB family antitoxin [Geminicoccaceae bacterium]